MFRAFPGCYCFLREEKGCSLLRVNLCIGWEMLFVNIEKGKTSANQTKPVGSRPWITEVETENSRPRFFFHQCFRKRRNFPTHFRSAKIIGRLFGGGLNIGPTIRKYLHWICDGSGFRKTFFEGALVG